MTEFEPLTCAVGSDHPTNRATTTSQAQAVLSLYWEKDDNKQKRGRVWPTYLKNTLANSVTDISKVQIHNFF